MVKDKQMKLPKHGVADTLRYTIAILGIAFVAISVAQKQPWKHIGPLYDKVMERVAPKK